MSIESVLANVDKWHIEAGNCRDGLARIPGKSVQCVVTSPPYFNLRAYLASREFPLVVNGDPSAFENSAENTGAIAQAFADEWSENTAAEWNIAYGTERCRYDALPSVEMRDKDGVAV